VSAPVVIETTAGPLPLAEVALEIGDRTWSILHSDAVLTREEEYAFLRGESATKRPYGVVLWPAALALAHELASRALEGVRLLELGAGTGLPGIVAAARGARVVQTDRQHLIKLVCEKNAQRNGVTSIETRIADWTAWTDTERYDLVVGSDILYAPDLHPSLRHIFATNLAPGGTLLLADPYRAPSLQFLEQLEAEGWRVALDKWTVGIAPPPRQVGVFRATAP